MSARSTRTTSPRRTSSSGPRRGWCATASRRSSTARPRSRPSAPRPGQPVVIDNRPGVAGILGTEIVVNSPPDGYTLLLTSTAPIAFAPSTPKPLGYDPVRDLQHIAVLGTIPLAFVVPAAATARNV